MKRWAAPAEVAERLGLHPRTITNMARTGQLPGAVQIGNRWRFNLEALEAGLLAAQASGGGGDGENQ